MNINELVESNRKQFLRWRYEREHEAVTVEQEDIEEYFASVMYGDLVELHRRHDASDSDIANYVRLTNELVQSFLNELHLEKYKEWFRTIKESEEPLRTKRLSDLMDKLKAEYEIPLFNYDEYAKAHPEVFSLYREISSARDL